MRIFGVHITEEKREELIGKIKKYLGEKKHQNGGWVLSSIGPELLLLAKKDPYFKKLLNETTIVFPEGSGMSYTSLFLYGKWIPKIPGVDFVYDLLGLAEKYHKKVLCVLAEEGLSNEKEVENILRKEFPRLQIFSCSAFSNHSMISPKRRGVMNSFSEKICHIFKKVKPDIVFVALGQGIQEKWIFQHREKFLDVSLWMGVGGSFDFFTRKVRRAPKIFRRFGLEWLWRFFLSPRKRFRRIFNAVIIFPLLMIFKKCGIIS